MVDDWGDSLDKAELVAFRHRKQTCHNIFRLSIGEQMGSWPLLEAERGLVHVAIAGSPRHGFGQDLQVVIRTSEHGLQ